MDTFERKETKYLLTPMQYIQFRALAEGHMLPAEFPEGDVRSVYYDTPDDLLVNRSINGGKYKEKLRVRSYGPAAQDSPVFIEIKKKFKGITYKRRVNCSYAAANAFLSGMDYSEAAQRWPLANAETQAASLGTTARQIAGEIAWMRDHYTGLAPKMLVTTHRMSFIDANDPSLRLTFDADVRWDDAAPALDKHTAWHPLFSGSERILEVKCGDAYPLWLVAALNECGIRPQSVSKYGRAYQAAMLRKMPVRPGAAPASAPCSAASTKPATAPQAKPRATSLAAFIRSALQGGTVAKPAHGFASTKGHVGIPASIPASIPAMHRRAAAHACD